MTGYRPGGKAHMDDRTKLYRLTGMVKAAG